MLIRDNIIKLGIGTSSVQINGYSLPITAGTSSYVLTSNGSNELYWSLPSSGGISGTGTTNYLAKWNSGGLTNSLVYDNGTNVGIGISSFTAYNEKLRVNGPTVLQDARFGASGESGLISYSPGNNFGVISGNGHNLYLWNVSGNNMLFYYSVSQTLGGSMDSNGNWLFGNGSANAKAHIISTSGTSFRIDGSTNNTFAVSHGGNVFINTNGSNDGLTSAKIYAKYSGGANDAGVLSLQVESNTSERATWSQAAIFVSPHTTSTSRYGQVFNSRHANNNGAAYLGIYYVGDQDTDLYFSSNSGTGNPILYMDNSTGSVMIDRALGSIANGKLDVNGTINSISGYKFNNTAGFTGTGTYTNFTIQGGIITAAS
jgi:hypothetical protein